MSRAEKKQSGERRPKYILLKILAALAVITAVLGAFSFPMKTVFYEITSDKVSERVRIVQITDLHTTPYGKDMKTLIDAVDAVSPDIVVFTGDIFHEHRNNTNSLTFLSAMGEKYICLFAAGNHEFRSDEWRDKYKEMTENCGIIVLEGDTFLANGIAVCGAGQAADGSLYWYEARQKCAETAADLNCFTVLLDHYPENVDENRGYGCFDLMLSGHEHGGQWRIPGIMNGFYAPGEGLFPKYAGGRYDYPEDGFTMIVSRGLDRSSNPVPRIFNNPELVVVDIVPE